MDRRTLLIGAGAAATSACWHPVYSWRQKLTIEVESDGKVYSGSSVIRVEWNEAYGGRLTGRPFEDRMRGEAAFVDVPGGGTLFALLRSKASQDYSKQIAFIAFGYFPKPGITIESIKSLSHAQGRKATLSPDQFPMLVAFADVNDPMSVKEVPPDDLESVFGPGARLKSISIEITDEQVTSLILTKLP